MKRIFTAFVLWAVVMMFTGCGKMKTFVDASARLAAQVNNLEAQTEKSYDDQLIDKPTSLWIAKKVKNELNPAVGVYTDFVETLSKASPTGSTEKPKASDWVKARSLFSAVTKSFNEIALRIKLLTPEQSALLSVVIAAIQELIDTILGLVADAQHYFKEEESWQILQTS
jgi:hypothetical protein